MLNDLLPIRIVTLALAIGFLGSIGAITFLASTQTPIPDSLSDIPVFAGGALAGLLANTRSGDRDAVTIDQPDDEPIPVEQVEP